MPGKGQGEVFELATFKYSVSKHLYCFLFNRVLKIKIELSGVFIKGLWACLPLTKYLVSQIL